MTLFDVYLNLGRGAVKDGGPLAHLPALTGCVARGADEEQALQRLGRAAEEYIELYRLDLDPTQIDFAVHKVEINVFPCDFEPLDGQEIETYFQRMEISRHALLDLVGNLPDQALDWQPDESTWPIRRILEHVADAEWWYLSRLNDWPVDPFERLAAVHRFVLDTVSGWGDHDLSRTFRWGRHREWSARKVLRVLLDNEETERQAIERLLAWKNAGREPGPPVPEVKTDTLEGDLEPLASGDRDEWHRRKQASRTQLLALVKGPPEEILDFQPAAGERSTRQLLQQLTDDEWWIATRLQDRPQDLFDRLRQAREMVIDRLGRLDSQERTRVTLHAEEEWTARKVFRRILEHEWEHRQQIRELRDLHQVQTP